MARTTVEERRNEILEVTCQVVIERGFGATRDRRRRRPSLGVSTGLIHYHFESKDQLLAEAFQWAAEADLARLHAEVEPGRHRRRAPRAGHPPLRTRRGRAGLDAVDRRLGRGVAQPDAAEDQPGARPAVAAGHRRRRPRRASTARRVPCADPEATAWRLTALLDGLGLQVTVHEGLLTRDELLRCVHTARRATELDVPEASFERAAKRVARDVA